MNFPNPDSPKPPATSKTTPKLHQHFWFDLNKGKSIDVDDGASYHIQHVVRNPEQYGFKDSSEMEALAHHKIEDLESGYWSTDRKLESAVMKKGFVRGYHNKGGTTFNDRGLESYPGSINFDVHTPEHMHQALNHFLPHIKDNTDINVSVGHGGDYTTHFFRGHAAVKAHIAGVDAKNEAEAAAAKSLADNAAASNRAAEIKKKREDPVAPDAGGSRSLDYNTTLASVNKYFPNEPRTLRIGRVEKIRGIMGDSVDFKRSYKEFFREMVNKDQTIETPNSEPISQPIKPYVWLKTPNSEPTTPEPAKPLNKLPSHFWLNLHTGKGIDVDRDGHAASYHIQHVVRNPEMYGFNNSREMEQHTLNSIEHIESGVNDVDYDLEHHIMSKGFARGYNSASDGYGIRFDVATHEHMNKALEHMLPHIRDNTQVDVSVGHRALQSYGEETTKTYKGLKEVKAHLAGIQLKKSQMQMDQDKANATPNTAPMSYGSVFQSMRRTFPKASTIQIRSNTDAVRGTWGDSVDLKKSYKEFFCEMVKEANQFDAVVNPTQVSTRLPSFMGRKKRGKPAPQIGPDPNTLTGPNSLSVDQSLMHEPEEHKVLVSLADKIRSPIRIKDSEKKGRTITPTYSNVSPDMQKIQDPHEFIHAVGQGMEKNIEWAADRTDSIHELGERSEQWYDGAHKIAGDFAKKFNVPHHVAAAVIAVQSPQKDWNQNVSLAERILKVHTEHQNTRWTPQMEKITSKVFDDESTTHRAILSNIRGKTYGELNNPLHKAAWIRTYDEAHHARHHRDITPEGEFGEHVTGKIIGSKRKDTSWASFSGIAKAVRALESNGHMPSISAALGKQHKVRSFYNNIAQPNSPMGDVTIDTHAIGNALGRYSIAGTSPETSDVLGGSPSSSRTGMRGTYPLAQQSFTNVSNRRGSLPRKIQSKVWTGRRADDATDAQKAAIDANFEYLRSGEMTHDQVLRANTGVLGPQKPPTWLSTRLGPGSGHTSTFESVQRKSYKEFFVELIELNASTELRNARRPSQQNRLNRAGGSSGIIGAVAGTAGMSSSKLAALEKRAAKGQRIPPADAAKLSAALLKK